VRSLGGIKSNKIRDYEILDFIREHPGCSRQAIADHWGISITWANYFLRILKKNGDIEFFGKKGLPKLIYITATYEPEPPILKIKPSGVKPPSPPRNDVELNKICEELSNKNTTQEFEEILRIEPQNLFRLNSNHRFRESGLIEGDAILDNYIETVFIQIQEKKITRWLRKGFVRGGLIELVGRYGYKITEKGRDLLRQSDKNT
jgi:succinate dehydrogenase flavin-adding protein (antitoxin of CptAB toxin-antitoxin module)